MSDNQDSGISSPSQSRRSSTASDMSGQRPRQSGMQGVARNPSQDRRRRGSSGQGHGQGIARNPATDRRRRGNRGQSSNRRSSVSRSRRSTATGRGSSGRDGHRPGMQGVARNPSTDRRRRGNRGGRSTTGARSSMGSRSTMSRSTMSRAGGSRASRASSGRSSSRQSGMQGIARNPSTDRRRRGNRSRASNMS